MKNWMKVIGFVLISSIYFGTLCQAKESKNLNVENEGQQQIKIEDQRYIPIYHEDEYTYYLDNATKKKIKHPYLEEEILDVWVKIEGNEDGVYTDPVSYTMKHYYVRLKEKQMQLVNTIEFIGGISPSYSADTPYREKNWKTVVPTSREENCYLKIIELVK
ncbi:hypothetical protein [Anaerosinus massiliensis]|uniref:hypothetical protein n=1 Tax=Massilibacillus massiliensis TaxID=1806837 RepID=UPI000DA61B85|nr:hypothetical protein [Massilibacillus massiliensis]